MGEAAGYVCGGKPARGGVRVLPPGHRFVLAAFERGELGLIELRDLAEQNGEPASISGRQEWLENLINQYI